MKSDVLTFHAGHYGKDRNQGTGRPESGACEPVARVCEADWTPDACVHAALAARAQGAPAHALTLGDYSEREALLRGLPAVAVHVHGDAGGQGLDEARVFYWPGNGEGLELAQALARELRGVLPWPVAVLAASSSWPRVRGVLGVNAGTSVLVEAGFTDGQLGAAWLPAHARELGEALGRGGATWRAA